MSPRIIVSAIVIIFGFLGMPAWGAEKGGGGISKDDLAALCLIADRVCQAGCKRKNNVSGVIQESFCMDDCAEAKHRCVSTIASRKKTKGTTGVPEGGKGMLSE